MGVQASVFMSDLVEELIIILIGFLAPENCGDKTNDKTYKLCAFTSYRATY